MLAQVDRTRKYCSKALAWVAVEEEINIKITFKIPFTSAGKLCQISRIAQPSPRYSAFFCQA